MPVQPGDNIRVLLAVGFPSSAKGIARLLLPADDIAVAATARSAAEAIDLARIVQPDVIILDPLITNLDIMATIEKLAGDLPSASILLISGTTEPNFLQRALQAGAKACLPWAPDGDRLIENIRRLTRPGDLED